MHFLGNTPLRRVCFARLAFFATKLAFYASSATLLIGKEAIESSRIPRNGRKIGQDSLALSVRVNAGHHAKNALAVDAKCTGHYIYHRASHYLLHPWQALKSASEHLDFPLIASRRGLSRLLLAPLSRSIPQ